MLRVFAVSFIIALALLPTYLSGGKPKAAVPLQSISTQDILKTEYKITYPESEILAFVIDSAAKKESISPSLLIAVIDHESGFRPRRGKDGEYGYMQVLPTWSDKTPYRIDHPYENIYAGAWILHHYSETLGNLRDTLAAYNVGVTRFKRGDGQPVGYQYADSILKVQECLHGLYTAHTMDSKPSCS